MKSILPMIILAHAFLSASSAESIQLPGWCEDNWRADMYLEASSANNEGWIAAHVTEDSARQTVHVLRSGGDLTTTGSSSWWETPTLEFAETATHLKVVSDSKGTVWVGAQDVLGDADTVAFWRLKSGSGQAWEQVGRELSCVSLQSPPANQLNLVVDANDRVLFSCNSAEDDSNNVVFAYNHTMDNFQKEVVAPFYVDAGLEQQHVRRTETLGYDGDTLYRTYSTLWNPTERIEMERYNNTSGQWDIIAKFFGTASEAVPFIFDGKNQMHLLETDAAREVYWNVLDSTTFEEIERTKVGDFRTNQLISSPISKDSPSALLGGSTGLYEDFVFLEGGPGGKQYVLRDLSAATATFYDGDPYFLTCSLDGVLSIVDLQSATPQPPTSSPKDSNDSSNGIFALSLLALIPLTAIGYLFCRKWSRSRSGSKCDENPAASNTPNNENQMGVTAETLPRNKDQARSVALPGNERTSFVPLADIEQAYVTTRQAQDPPAQNQAYMPDQKDQCRDVPLENRNAEPPLAAVVLIDGVVKE